VSGSTLQQGEFSLGGRRVAFVGRLVSMSRREAEQIIHQRGGRVLERLSADADVIVISDQAAELDRLLADRDCFPDEVRAAISRGELELVRESQLWARLGLVDASEGIERLYTAAMMAELVSVPLAAIRQWQRQGALRPNLEVRRLAYFDFTEVNIARKLAALLRAGCSLAVINRKLAELNRLLPNLPRPLAEPTVVVEGRRLVIRRADGLAEPTGQLLIDFDAATSPVPCTDHPVTIPLVAAEALQKPTFKPGSTPMPAADLRNLAAELEELGHIDQAIELYRAILISGDFTPEDHFALAELLYRNGDLSAARERYYMAIELDEDFVEARSNLGCLLAEQGELPLAEAAFRGALEYHPDYADAHYHLARLLDRLNRSSEAARHWQLFVNLAPASPWVEEARNRLGQGQ
jgi:tetratricopeptide (TPR) repeat protein